MRILLLIFPNSLFIRARLILSCLWINLIMFSVIMKLGQNIEWNPIELVVRCVLKFILVCSLSHLLIGITPMMLMFRLKPLRVIGLFLILRKLLLVLLLSKMRISLSLKVSSFSILRKNVLCLRILWPVWISFNTMRKYTCRDCYYYCDTGHCLWTSALVNATDEACCEYVTDPYF